MTVLVRRSVPRTLFSMAYPMLAGTFAINAYNLTDTWFVSRLGTLPLAAMGFTFPVVMLMMCVAGGLGTGITTLMSHAVGRRDFAQAERFVSHGVTLNVIAMTILAITGYFLVNPIFRMLGADARTLPLIGEYMRTWYAGAIFMSLPMLGNGILISVGDSKSASLFIVLGTVVNIVLDPVMIFGLLGCPAMGIRGAALATVIAQAVSTVWLIHLLSRKHSLLSLRKWRLDEYMVSMWRIASFAIPSIASMLLHPISATVITRILSQFGAEAVAAAGAAGRIEAFAFMIPMALGMSLTPFVSQNYGARRMDRLREAMKTTVGFALSYGGFTTAVFFVCAPWMAAFFTSDPKVAATLVLYIRIIAFGYGMMETHRYCSFFLTGMHMPLASSLLNALRVVVLLVPLSCLGAHYWGIPGLFSARLATDLIVGSVGIIYVGRVMKAKSLAI